MQKREELIKQIKAYNLDGKLKELAKKDEEKRPFRHLPKQFSKGILIGNIAIVPRKSDETRYVYVIADMIKAKVLFDDVCLKQTAILIAHYLADQKSIPFSVIELDGRFASKLFDIKNFKRHYRLAQKEGDEKLEFIYENKLIETNRIADEIKDKIHSIFDATFKTQI